MRRTIIAGNWKMNCTRADARALVAGVVVAASQRPDVEVLVCPPYTALETATAAAAGTNVGVAAQNLFWKPKGAYTGQISAAMLVDLKISTVLVGHSETRGRFGVPEPDFDEAVLRHFGESDETVNRKVITALAAGIRPIICVGETLAERSAGATDVVVADQVRKALQNIDPAQNEVVFAYEPVWAIGTGEVCAPDEANRVCGVIRQTVAELSTQSAASSLRVQYGGSVKPDNAADLLSRTNIDGALVGGASLNAADFTAIILAAPV